MAAQTCWVYTKKKDMTNSEAITQKHREEKQIGLM